MKFTIAEEIPRRLLDSLAAAMLTLIAIAGAGPSIAADHDKAVLTVNLTREQTANLGIVTVPARAVTYTAEIDGYGVVIGLDAIAQADADLMTAEAGAKQSAAALKRATELTLGREAAVSQDALAIAQRQAAADSAALTLAHSKSMAMFGREAPWRDPAQHDAIMEGLADGRLALVRATFPLGAGKAPTTVRIARLGHETNSSWTSGRIWAAPADASIPGSSYFALVEGDLVSGEHVLVAQPAGETRAGIVVPADAILLSDNAPWFYVSDGGGTYTRHQLDLSLTMPGGYFVSSGINAGAQIVVRGAGLLLARELNPSAESRD